MKSVIAFAFAALSAVSLAQGMCMTPPQVTSIVALPSGTIIEGVGSTDLPITTKSEKARQLTKQGFALMHCFWFNEAVRSFRDATKEDPACAAAWLGLNASLTLPWHSPSNMRPEADYAIKRAVATCGDATSVEQSMVAAFRLRSAGVSDLEGEFEKAMMRVVESHSEMFEPRLMLALIRTQICMGVDYDDNLDPRTELDKVLALIAPVLAKDPHNAGALHYHIHALEGSKPDQAVISADRLTKAAPASGHMVHMPGHIYNRVGMYEKARQSFLESVRVHEEYAKRIPGAQPTVDWNYSHDLDYLIFNLAEMGRISEAEALLAKNPGSSQMLAWRAGQWDKLATRSRQPYFLGMAAMEKGDLAAAETEVAKLEQSVKQLEGQNSRGGVTRRRMEQIRAAELRGLILSRQGKHEEAMAKLAEATKVFEKLGYSEPPYLPRTPYESAGWVQLAANRPNGAIAAFQAGLRHRPNSGWMLYGIAVAHEKAGRKEDAARAHKEFLKAWEGADADHPMMVDAKKAVARLGS